jgi:hypothetical protein
MESTILFHRIRHYHDRHSLAVSKPEFHCRVRGSNQSQVVPHAQNLKEIGLPSWIAKYNGKPFLIKRLGETGLMYRHPEKSCIEFDISLHPFLYLAKQGIFYMKDMFFKKVLITFGFLIE